MATARFYIIKQFFWCWWYPMVTGVFNYDFFMYTWWNEINILNLRKNYNFPEINAPVSYTRCKTFLILFKKKSHFLIYIVVVVVFINTIKLRQIKLCLWQKLQGLIYFFLLFGLVSSRVRVLFNRYFCVNVNLKSRCG